MVARFYKFEKRVFEPLKVNESASISHGAAKRQPRKGVCNQSEREQLLPKK